MVEARDQLREEGIATSYCRIRALPVSDEVKHFIERHLRVYVVEQNRDAQVTSILKSTLSGALADRLDSDHALQRHAARRPEHRSADPELGEEPLRARLADRRRRAGQPAGAPRGGAVGRIDPGRLAACTDISGRRSITSLDFHTHSERSTEAIQSWPAKPSIQVQSNGLSFTLPTVAFQGLPSTLCKGCGHNSITSYLIEACKSIGVNPYNTIKLSGIGCSSKTPAYFLQASHGFNALHGRMPSVATGRAGGQSQAAVHRHQRRRRHGQHRHGPVQAHLPPQRADRLHRREQRLLRPDQGPVLGDRRPEPAPAAADRRSQRRRRRSTSAPRRSSAAPRSSRGRSPATRSRWSRS